MNMQISNAILQDVPAIMKLLSAVIEKMQGMDLTNWSEKYPSQKRVEEDIMQKTLYKAVVEDKIIGIVTIDDSQNKAYNQIEWGIDLDVNSDKALVVHRLGIHPEMQGKGVAKEIMTFVENHAQNNGYAAIRLDAWPSGPAKFLYRSLKYNEVGIVHFVPGGQSEPKPFICFEKVL